MLEIDLNHCDTDLRKILEQRARRARRAADSIEKLIHKNKQPFFKSMSRVHKMRRQKG